MTEAAQYLLGEHNFIAFGRPLSEFGTSTRRIEQAKWELSGADSMEFAITGIAFLYHMVRRIVYVLVKVGFSKVPVEIIPTGLQTGSTGIVSLAPARGLTLIQVRYAEDLEK